MARGVHEGMRFETAGDAYRWAVEEWGGFLSARTVDFDRSGGGGGVKSRPSDAVCIAFHIMRVVDSCDAELRNADSALEYYYMHPAVEPKQYLSREEQMVVDECEEKFICALKSCGYL